MDIISKKDLMDSEDMEFMVDTEIEGLVKKQSEIYKVSPLGVVRLRDCFINESGDILIKRRDSSFVCIYNKRLTKGSFCSSYEYWRHKASLELAAGYYWAFTLAWGRSPVTDKNDSEYLKRFTRLPFREFEQITMTREEEERALKEKSCDYVDAKVDLSTSSLENEDQSTLPLENENRYLKDKVAELNKRISEYDGKIAELNAELERKNLAQNSCVVEEISAHGAHLQTGEVLHLVEHSGIRNGNKSSNQEWAVVLSLLTGCSVNTLRQKMSKPDLSDGARGKVEKLYNEALEELKKKNKGSV